MTEIIINKVGDYTIFDTDLGSGSFALVKKCQDAEGNCYAAKIIEKVNIENVNHVLDEIKTLQKMDHPNVTKFFDVFQSEKKLYLILELCDGPTLFDILEEKRLNEKTALSYFTQIVCGLEYLNSKNIIHRDLKPANILTTRDGCLKISDFGFSKTMEDVERKKNLTCMGTEYYSSPQIIMGEKYSGKCDIFSLGIILYEMIYTRHPFVDFQEKSSFKRTEMLKLTDLMFPDENQRSKSLIELFKGMLAKNEENRLNIKQVSSLLQKINKIASLDESVIFQDSSKVMVTISMLLSNKIGEIAHKPKEEILNTLYGLNPKSLEESCNVEEDISYPNKVSEFIFILKSNKYCFQTTQIYNSPSLEQLIEQIAYGESILSILENQEVPEIYPDKLSLLKLMLWLYNEIYSKVSYEENASDNIIIQKYEEKKEFTITNRVNQLKSLLEKYPIITEVKGFQQELSDLKRRSKEFCEANLITNYKILHTAVSLWCSFLEHLSHSALENLRSFIENNLKL